MTVDDVLAGLDDEQRAAVTAPAGPLCILAGAGTGKTRAITHRIAHRVRSGQVQPQQVLAVTFTARAAAELRARLGMLGAGGVSARTFHAAALRQLRYFAPRIFHGRAMPELVDSKARLITLAAAKTGHRGERTLARDLASEIEWAKSSLVEPGDYPAVATKAGRELPLAADQVAAVFSEYERAKRAAGMIDFEDVLRAAAWAMEEHADVAEQIRSQYRHFVVDEYQDVNPVQQKLLETWLAGRDDLTVVGDASQTIYSFTGATSGYLVDFPRQHKNATVVRLFRDYRSTPQVVALANAVISEARGTEARLRLELVGQRRPGPEPEVRDFSDEPAEAAAVAARCAALIDAGTPPSEIAVLYRINAQSEVYEGALADAGVPYVLQGSERFFERGEVRQAMVALRVATRTADPDAPLVPTVAEALDAVGWRSENPPAGGAAREKWEALAALVGLAEEFAASRSAQDQEDTSLAAFTAELDRRAAAQHAPTVEGVTLASLHSAKGLEWDAVFLVGLADGTLPTTYAKTPEALEEERRLLYVGITRAREWLWLSWAAARAAGGRQSRRPSRFLPAGPARAASVAPVPKKRDRVVAKSVSCRVCGVTLMDAMERKLGRCATCPSTMDEELLGRLQEWRALVARAARVPAYVVFTDATLTAIAEQLPSGEPQLVAIAGIGPRKLGLYGEAVLALVAGKSVADILPEGATG
ncbi:ATP-dependent DNA helicase UvrD2 [Longispora sp. K20-0274]|uniref:ATP-dependent DNA helicase UvrD2 n=1 Tax=Longispora sp. K20-0274 TaxID=3088255 RepID=UPI00399ABAA4